LSRIADASVAVALLIESPRSPIARDVFASEAELLAPDLIVCETANALWNARPAVTVSPQTVAAYIARLRERIDIVPSPPLVEEAFQIAVDLDHPIDECLYLALARRERSELLTFDRHLVRKIAETKYASLAQALPYRRDAQA